MGCRLERLLGGIVVKCEQPKHLDLKQITAIIFKSKEGKSYKAIAYEMNVTYRQVYHLKEKGIL